MQRPSDFRTSHGGFVTPYRYGDRKWEDYLLDTQTYIYDGAREQIEAAERVGRQATEQRDRQMSLLQDFIADAQGAWERVSSQLDTLTDHLVNGFSALSYQLKYHGELLEQIVGRLGHIAKSIANPLGTQANELVRSGQHLMQRGLYREAYNDFTAAEGKRSVNPMLHLYLTQLHYHVRDEGVPFDLAAAELHANLAIRYATSLRDDLEEDGAAVVDLVYRTAAHLALVKGGDLSKSAGAEAGEVELRRGDGFLGQIDQPSPSSRFLHAQVLALLHRPDESIAKIRTLADYTRSWIPRALLEPNLGTVADSVRALSDDLRVAPGEHSENVYRTIDAAREFAALCTSIAREFSSATADMSVQIDEIEHDFEAGAIDAPSALSVIEGAVETAKSGTRAVITAYIGQLEAERDLATNKAESHEASARSLRQNAFTAGGCGEMVDGIFAIGLLGSLFGWLAGMAACSGHILHNFGDFVVAGPIGAILAVLGVWTMSLVSVIGNRPKALAEDASAVHSRARTKYIERMLNDVRRMRDSLGL